MTETELISGETVLYGRVLQVGGKDPRIGIETIQGKTLYCSASEGVAREVAGRLYEDVGLRGIAGWNTTTLALETFQVKELLPYERKPAREAFAELAELVGESYLDVNSPDHFLKELRG